MIRRRLRREAMCALVALIWMSGCDERVVEVAREAADRQAAQNQQMGELQKEVARGTRSLVEADASARREIVGVHRDLQAERQQLGSGWHDLEIQRQRIAKERRTESLLVPLASTVAGAALVIVLLGFLRQLLASSHSSDPADAELNELLVEQLLAVESGAGETPGMSLEPNERIAGRVATSDLSLPQHDTT